jgi:hypothetical protein
MTTGEWDTLPALRVPFNWHAFWRRYRHLAGQPGTLGERLGHAAAFLGLYAANQLTWFADQWLSPNWHRVAMNGPVFIIGHQRSGSTFLHRALARDPNALALNLRQMMLPAISGQRLWEAVFRPGSRPANWLDRLQDRHLGELDAVHHIRLDSIEEDEFVFLAAYRSGMAVNSSPAVAGDEELDRLRDFRSWSEADRRMALEWYRACLLKAAYRAEVKAPNPDRWIVAKNPAFSQRIPDLLKVFPSARFINLVRNPLQAVPSRLSLVRAIWRLRRPDFETMSTDEVEAIVADSERTYKLALNDLRDLPRETAITIRFEALASEPNAVLKRIYDQLRLPGAPVPVSERADRKDTAGTSSHSYSLEEFGLTEAGLRRRFAPVMKAYGF